MRKVVFAAVFGLIAVGIGRLFVACGGVVVPSGTGGSTGGSTSEQTTNSAGGACDVPAEKRPADGSCCQWVAPSVAPQCDSPGAVCGEAQYAYRCAIGAAPSGEGCWVPDAPTVCGGAWQLACCYEAQ